MCHRLLISGLDAVEQSWRKEWLESIWNLSHHSAEMYLVIEAVYNMLLHARTRARTHTHTLFRGKPDQSSPITLQFIFYIRIINLMVAVMYCSKDRTCRICLSQWFFSPMISWKGLRLCSRSRTWHDGHSFCCIRPPKPPCTITKKLHRQTVWTITYKSGERWRCVLIFMVNFLQARPIRRKAAISQSFIATSLLYKVKSVHYYNSVIQIEYCGILIQMYFCTSNLHFHLLLEFH